MNGRVVQKASVPAHTCHPGEELRERDMTGVDPVTGMDRSSDIYAEIFGARYWHDLRLPAGTVWECECGKSWVAKWIPDEVGQRSVRCAHVEWRPEKRRERRRRESAS